MHGKRKKHQSVKLLKANPTGSPALAGDAGAASPSVPPTAVSVVATTSTPGEGGETPTGAVAVGAVTAVSAATAVVPTAEDGTPAASSQVASGEPGASGEAGSGKAKRTRARGGTTPRWSEEEERELLRLRESLGDRAWQGIADGLGTGRSASGVEQHWCVSGHTPCAPPARVQWLPSAPAS